MCEKKHNNVKLVIPVSFQQNIFSGICTSNVVGILFGIPQAYSVTNDYFGMGATLGTTKPLLFYFDKL